MLHNHLSPSPFPPPWAASWGEDACGLWLTLGLNGIRQMFRWIRPGIFQMGAEEEENAHLRLLAKETLHEVTLSKGFWLANTAITQELWQAVMKGNPSGFRGANRPVERVSWSHAQQFIRRLNSLIPGLVARLPTEAEWEYACRAGSTTPFSFGLEISTEQVNYQSGASSRLHTVPVKTLPCNHWGIYEMHGNIWEWCQDYWQEDLTAEAVIDPQGPEQGEFRLTRGGSWVYPSRFIRSAYRDRYFPNYAGGSIGFRLAV